MADRIQQRRDTAARWAQFNPILLEGEVGYVLDSPNQYKIGDGVNAWNNLPLRGYSGTVTDKAGGDENAVMSQAASSDSFLAMNLEDVMTLLNIPHTITMGNGGTGQSGRYTIDQTALFLPQDLKFDLYLKGSIARPLASGEAINLYVELSFSDSTSKNVLTKSIIPGGVGSSVLEYRLHGYDLNLSLIPEGETVTGYRLIIQWTGLATTNTMTLDSFKMSNDVVNANKIFVGNKNVDAKFDVVEGDIAAINDVIGPFLRYGAANNVTPPTMNTNNKNGICLNGYPVKKDDVWTYSGRAYWKGIWILKNDGSVDESLWPTGDHTYQNLEITMPADGKLYAWGIISSSSEVPTFSIIPAGAAGVPIMQQISLLNDSVKDNKEQITEIDNNIKNIQYIQGYFTSGHVYQNNTTGWCVNGLDVKAGEKYSYSGRYYYGALFMKKAEDDSIIDFIPANSNSSVKDFQITIPFDGKLYAWGLTTNGINQFLEFALYQIATRKYDQIAQEANTIATKNQENESNTRGLFTNKVNAFSFAEAEKTIAAGSSNVRYSVNIPIENLSVGDIVTLQFKLSSILTSNIWIGSSTNSGKFFKLIDGGDGYFYSEPVDISITKEYLALVNTSGKLPFFLQFGTNIAVATTVVAVEENTYITKNIKAMLVGESNADSYITNKSVTFSAASTVGRITSVIPATVIKQIIEEEGQFKMRCRFRSKNNANVGTGGLFFSLPDGTNKRLLTVTFQSDGTGGFISPIYEQEITLDFLGNNNTVTFLVQWQKSPNLDADTYSWEYLNFLGNRLDFLEERVDALENGTLDLNPIYKTLEIPFRGYSAMTPITVKKDGTGNFTSIQEAINSITDASISKQYDIQVYDDWEVYDLKELWRVNDIKNKNQEDNPTVTVALITTKNYVHIRGMKGGGNKLYVESPNNLASDSFQRIQTIYPMGNCIINNFYVGIKGGRYAIHQESGGSKTHLDYHAHTIYMNLVVEHKGNETYPNGSGWTSTMAQANGTTSGLKQTYINCKWISALSTPFYTHTNSEFDEPNEQTMINCSMICTKQNIKIGELGPYWGDIGSGQKSIMKFIGCSIPRFNMGGYGGPRGEETTNNVRVKYGYNGGSVIQGQSNAPMAVSVGYKPVLTFNAINNNVPLKVTGGTAYDLIWGSTWETIRESTVSPCYAFGSIRMSSALSWAKNSQVFCLAYYLGNCASSPKTLTLEVGGTTYTITFNKNYMTADGSAYSWNTVPAISDSQIIADINASNPTIFKANFNSPLSEVFTFEDCMELGINVDSVAWTAGKCLVRSLLGHQNWKLAQDGDMVEGIAGEFLAPSVANVGDNPCGKILYPTKSYFPISLFGLSGVTAGNLYKAGADGTLVITTNRSEASFVAVDSGYLIGVRR